MKFLKIILNKKMLTEKSREWVEADDFINIVPFFELLKNIVDGGVEDENENK